MKLEGLRKSLRQILKSYESGDASLAMYEVECLLMAVELEMNDPDLASYLEFDGHVQ